MRQATLASCGLLLSTFLIVGCSESPTEVAEVAQVPLASLIPEGSSLPPVTVDGVFDASEWMSPIGQPTISLPGGTSANARIYFRNDYENLYVGVVFGAELPAGSTTIFCAEFRSDPRQLTEGDDSICVYGGGSFIDDLVLTNSGGVLRWIDDVLVGGTNDGDAAGLTSGRETVLEMSHPLNSGDNGFDISAGVGDHLIAHYTIYIEYPAVGATYSDLGFYSNYVSCVVPQGFRGYGSGTPEC